MQQKIQTKSGYDFNELLSALQKDIRKGKIYPAMFWAVELESFNDKALWNRVRVIASEDISMHAWKWEHSRFWYIHTFPY